MENGKITKRKFLHSRKKLLKTMFSIKNTYRNGKNHKVFTILGIKFKVRFGKDRFTYVKNALNSEERLAFSHNAILFRYDYFFGFNKSRYHCGVNLGDYVQTIATKNILQSLMPNINFIFKDRDNLLNYSGEKAFTIMQGWFSHSNMYLTNENILPIFIGTHITSTKRKRFIELVKCNPQYFENIVFGCRDTSTLEFMKSINLNSYLSRCLTLTFPKRENLDTQNKVFIVNIPKEYLKYIPETLTQKAEFINQRGVDSGKNIGYYIDTVEKYMEITQKLLGKYKNEAGLVITSALHCASPCIAMGIPTILIDFENKNDRFGSLHGVHKIYSKQDLINGDIDFNPKEPNIEELKKLLIKNVDLSLKETFGTPINKEELQQIQKDIENYNILNLS